MAPVELLAPRLAYRRARRHVDPGDRPVSAGLPGALGACDPSLPIELGRRLAEVPDVAGLVLRVPVGRPLTEPPVEVEAVVDDDARDTLDQLGRVQDCDDVAGGVAILRAAVDKDGARL